MDFNSAFDRSMGTEGSYVNNAADPGGETKFGISKRSYPSVDIKALTRDAAKVIYLKDFWNRAQIGKLPEGLQFQVFDAAINHGIENTVRMLQRAVGVADDGDIGDFTMKALLALSPSDQVVLFLAERLIFWTGLKNWPDAGKGWARRAAADLKFAAQDT